MISHWLWWSDKAIKLNFTTCFTVSPWLQGVTVMAPNHDVEILGDTWGVSRNIEILPSVSDILGPIFLAWSKPHFPRENWESISKFSGSFVDQVELLVWEVTNKYNDLASNQASLFTTNSSLFRSKEILRLYALKISL